MDKGRIAVLFAASLAAACSAAPGSRLSAVPPVAPDKARIYVYRPLASYETTAWTRVALNGQAIGDAGPGTAFYRDVAPGTYAVAARSDGPSPYPPRSVTLAPGDAAFFRVESVEWRALSFITTIFVPEPVDAELGRREIERLGLVPG